MIQLSKTTFTVLALLTATAILTASADAKGRGGSSRGRSLRSASGHNNGGHRGSVGNTIGNNNAVRNHIGKQSINRIGSRPIGHKIGNPIGNKIGMKIGNGNPIGNKIGNKIGNGGGNLKHNTMLKHGHVHALHGHHHHHKHNHWGGWLNHGYHGWGFGHHHPRRWFVYSYHVPVASYCNPYCEPTGFFPENAPAFDYSQPINGQGGANEEGINEFSAAFDAFAKGDYNTALAEADKAAKQMPGNADVHQFRSLVLFAMKRYRGSASAAHAALVGGRGWNWETLRSFYASKNVYAAQLRSLEDYTTANSKDAGSLFLLSYHYLMMGHGEAAAKQLRTVVALEPKDTLAAKLLTAVDKNATIPQQQNGPMNEQPMNEQPMESGNDTPAPPIGSNESPMIVQPNITAPGQPILPPVPPIGTDAPKTEKPVVPALNEVGSWKATKADGAVFTLNLSADSKFLWSIKAEGKSFDVKGNYELKDGKLKLNSDNGNGALEGVLTVKNAKQFELKLQYQPEGEAGLLFSRQ